MTDEELQMTDVQHIRGFNYQPSYAYTGADIWRRFDAGMFERELGRGKQYFPRMNGLRLWLAWEVFGQGSERGRDEFLDNVDAALDIADDHGLVVMPVLFNRWHAGAPDWGGVYLDHFLPNAGWAGFGFQQRCGEYVAGLMERFGQDRRIFAWDLCNEPFSYAGRTAEPDARWELPKHELAWLEALYAHCKDQGARAPVSVGFHNGTRYLKHYEHLSDVLNFHYYWRGEAETKDDFRRELDACVDIRERTGKPLISTEACWGSLDNEKRVKIIEFHLDELNKRDIGWLVYALHHSYVADLHWPQYGRITSPGTLHCIEPDGTLRPGHEVINRFF
jgi:hypothetical protein